MKRYFSSLLRLFLVIILSVNIPISAGFKKEKRSDSYVKALGKRLNFVFHDDKLKQTKLGVHVYSITKDETLFEKNADRALSPASTVKVLTAGVALKLLKPHYTFKTKVYQDGEIVNGILKGNLYLVGGGDPTLVTEQMYLLASRVYNAGIHKITGNIYVDGTIFDENHESKYRLDTDTDRPYNAPISGISYNYNTTTIRFYPGVTGAKPRAVAAPNTGYIKISNKAKTKAKGAYNIKASRKAKKTHDLVLVSGTMGRNSGVQKTYFSITKPELYAGMGLKHLLGQVGVDASRAKIISKKLVKGAKRIAKIESLPLREIVDRMNKFSNNFIAEVLIKMLGHEIKGGQGTVAKGLDVVKEEATKIGINTSGFKFVSGSGLTRDNRITARQFSKLLAYIYNDMDIMPELLSSLPIAGLDGTLRRRMQKTSAFGRLRGKTGSINGVSTLIGLVQAKGGEILAFSVLMNDMGKAPSSLREWQNYFGQAVADFSRR